MVIQDVAHLENMLDLFRKIDAVSRCVKDSRDYVDRQMIVVRGRESAAGNRRPESRMRLRRVKGRKANKANK